MKPLKLTFRGINSYRTEQVIDFSSLTSAGLFGIFGPTGSGKSSILDAITLALYAKLPRSTKNFIHINEQTAAVSFIFSITTTETRKYKVERSFRYHNAAAVSTVRNISGTLADITGDFPLILADRPTEVTQECIRLLGLTSDDFMRTVVLPQGQFSEFLKLKNADRRSMLQRIFHLEKYGLELTQKIASARQKQELLLSGLEGQLQTFAHITPESLKEIQQKQSKLSSEKKKTEKIKSAAEISFKEADALYTLSAEFEPIKEKHQKCMQQLPDIEKQEQRLAAGKKANLLRPFDEQAKRTAREYTKAASALAQIQVSFQQFLNDFHKLQEEKENICTQYEKKLPSFLNQEQELISAIERQTSINQWEQQKAAAEKQLQQYQIQMDALSAQNQFFVKQIAALKHNIAGLEEQAVQLKPSLSERTAFERGHLLEETYREKRQNYDNNEKSANKRKQYLHKQQAQLDILQQQLIHLHQFALYSADRIAQQQKENDEALLRLREQYAKTSAKLEYLQRQHLAAALRCQLQEGDICPVCGSVHDGKLPPANLQEHEKQQQIELLQYKMKEEEQKEQVLTNKKKELEHQLSLLNTGIQTIKNNERIPVKLKTAAPFLSDSPLKLRSLSPEELNQEIQMASAQYTSLHDQLSELLAQHQQEQKLLHTQHSLLQSSVQEIFSLREKWKIDNFTQKLEEMRKQENDYDTIENKIKTFRSQHENLLAQKTAADEKILTISKQISTSNSEITHYVRLIANEREKLPQNYSSNENFASLLHNIRIKKDALENRKSALELAFQESSGELLKKKEELAAAETRKLSCKENAAKAKNMLHEQWKNSGIALDILLDSLYLSEEDIETIEKELHTFQETFAKIKERMQYLQERLKNKEISKQAWLQHKTFYEETVQQWERLQREEAVLLQEKSNMQEQFIQKTNLEKEYNAALHRRGLIRQLEQLFKGNAFIEYVAESHLRYIAAEASSILSSISNGNYELDINESAEFIIRDNKNGGILRPCDTLSGGETFITSLSLALALSSVIQLNGTAPLELFFLDEGFGSLDEELLDIVMTSLEQLPNSRRSIGIITHVEAIQARVPVKLVVTPSDISQNGSSIHMEYS